MNQSSFNKTIICQHLEYSGLVAQAVVQLWCYNILVTICIQF